ncbi:MAG TPA: hypothetical protein VFV19_12325 [Candidatus Polarisedimenticolaceae bacterium]|nr:hypothetical protein [Candidatus Polarisedimenticolaceae bacterium]
MRRRLAVALLSLAAVLPAHAVDQGVTVETWGDAYRDGEPSVQGWFRLTYALDARLNRSVFVKVAAILEHESHGDVSRDVLYDADDRDLTRAALRFRDLAVGFRAGEVTVVLGKQRLTWGRTTFVNATDNLTPRDWTDPLAEVRLSPWSADAVWEHERWHVEGALVPQYAPSRLPQIGERWFAAPPGTELQWGSASFPPVTWDTLQGAVRGGYRGSRGEVTVSYFRGYDDAPRITAIPGLPDPVTGLVPVTLDRTFPRLDVAGVDGEVLLGAWIVRGEGGYFHYPGGQEGYALYQVEAEWSQGPWRAIAGWGDTVGGGSLAVAATSLDAAYLPAIFLSGTYGEATEWRVDVTATVGTRDWDSFVRIDGSYPFAGHARAGAEIDLIGGSPTSFWGVWRSNDRLRVFLKLDY